MNPEPMIDVPKLATILACDRRKASQLCASGRIPAKNIAEPLARKKAWRVRLSDLMRYLEQPDNAPSPAVDRPAHFPPGVRRLV